MGDVLRQEATVSQPETGTSIPDDTGLAAIEQRAAPRFTLLIRAAKLLTSEGEFMCVVRDASETGVNVRLFHPLPDVGDLVLELQNGDQHRLEVVWKEDDRAGMRFLDPVDIVRIIESPSRFSKRPIRVNLQTPARLADLEQTAPAELHDISQQGAKVTSDTRFAIDQRVRLSADGLPEVNAKVRWRRDAEYGLVFEDTFQFGDLARIIATIQLGQRA
ncbi:PilZ domain-containing protein [Alteraurantiacibacter aquimixticola]|uniref:PilZ domain-containing protein n=1 Tax=Alteraurantiacibacter aquimixticola TaxID=2489173 RepID=A0A4T3EX33_9SPHN|nr:PilZ domain-containing protein [Alteraurantiacibacter aquimixticola]TIX49018.1 PilZ domain-containing protein [Alteraurantiacibacter aquimixticola]